MYRKPLPVELDTESLKITFGKASISAFTRLKGVKGNYHLINEIMYGKGMLCTDLKKLYKDFSEEIGITPKAAVGVINNLGWKVIAGDFTSAQVFKWCYPRGCKRQISQHSVTTMHRMKDTLKQMLEDGQENLIPLVLKTEMTPKQIKDSLSKASWKRLTKVSFTKAQYISRAVNGKYVTKIPEYLELNTSYLANVNNLLSNVPHLVVNRLAKQRRCLTDADKIYDMARIVQDTMMIAEEIGYDVNPNWSWKRWSEEHTIVTRKRRAKEFSDKEILVGIYANLHREVVSEIGDKATLLTTALSVALEGDEMGHCVAGYARRCIKGEYVVYHLHLADGTVGTLGCTVEGTDKCPQLRYQQCYGKYNARIDTTFARQVIEQVNNHLVLYVGME